MILLILKQSIFSLISFVLIGGGIAFAIYWNGLYRSLVTNNVVLKPTSENFAIWQDPQFDIMFDIYIFNWTNPTNLNRKNFVKPILQQLGPYRFRERHFKSGMEWHNHNHTVSYRRRGMYTFDEEASNGSLDDEIVTFNTFAAAVAQTAHRDPSMNMFKRKMISDLLGGFISPYKQSLHIRKKAREIMFEGYSDKLIDLVRLGEKLGMKVNMPYDRFGYMYTRNGSVDWLGHFNVDTGADDISQLGKMRTWNYETTSPYFNGTCGNIRGSSGELFPPWRTKDESIAMFNGDLCRHVDLFFDKETKINGINAYKYVSTERTLDNGNKYNEYKCFNVKDYPSGVTDISGCRFDAPIASSLPHFYAADPSLLDDVEGLNPIKEDHQIEINIEPESGSPINLIGRMQINAVVRRTPGIAPFKDVHDFFFPIVWIEQNLYIPDDITWKLNVTVWISTIGYCFVGLLILIGISILLCTFLCPCCKRGKKRKHSVQGIYPQLETHGPTTPTAPTTSTIPVAPIFPILPSQSKSNELSK